MRMAFRDQAGRDHMDNTGPDGQADSFNKLEDYLASLQTAEARA
jgi:hypothetical protein